MARIWPLATRAATCHDQAVANLSKIVGRIDVLLPQIWRQVKLRLDLVGGPVAGVLMLSLGIETYRDGGSVGWPIAGSAVLLINLRVAWRRFSRLRKRATSP